MIAELASTFGLVFYYLNFWVSCYTKISLLFWRFSLCWTKKSKLKTFNTLSWPASWAKVLAMIQIKWKTAFLENCQEKKCGVSSFFEKFRLQFINSFTVNSELHKCFQTNLLKVFQATTYRQPFTSNVVQMLCPFVLFLLVPHLLSSLPLIQLPWESLKRSERKLT